MRATAHNEITNMSTPLVYYDGDLLGILPSDEEVAKLTAGQLLDAIYEDHRCVIRYPEGGFTLADQCSNDYQVIEHDGPPPPELTPRDV